MDSTLKYSLLSPIEEDLKHEEKFAELGRVHAGFPSPAEQLPDGRLDLNRYVVRHPASTFFLRVEGVSMVEDDFDEGDIVVVDKALEPRNGCVAVCFIDGEFTLKRVERDEKGFLLRPANPNYPAIRITPENDFQIWGVVTYVIKKV